MSDAVPWEGKNCPVCGEPLEDPRELTMWMGCRFTGGSYVCKACARLAETATDPTDDYAAGALCALLARATGRSLVR